MSPNGIIQPEFVNMSQKLSLVEIHQAGGYGSEFEYDSEADRKRARYDGLITKKKKTTDGVPSKREVEAEYCKEEGRNQRFHILSLDAYDRHKKFINDYLRFYGGSRDHFKPDTSKYKTDHDIIRENHRFLWNDDESGEETWDNRLAKKYYDKLFKEYCITDLSRYKENKVAMRWRTEKEVVDGKGQFHCGSRKCSVSSELRSWEVNFGYVEQGTKKNALVKLRLCPDCSYKLNHHHRKKEVTKSRKRKIDQPSSMPSASTAHGTGSSSSTAESIEKQSTSENATESESLSSDKDKSIWSGPAPITEEKSREEEFEDYFEDMFL